jgi:hypothetical protein
MWAKKRTLILTTILQMAPFFACADNASVAASPSQPAQDPAGRSLSRIDYLSSGILMVREKSVGAESTIRSEVTDAQSKVASSNTTSPTGLHWAVTNQRPAIEYRFSDQGAVRFHIAAHGAAAAAVLNF